MIRWFLVEGLIVLAWLFTGAAPARGEESHDFSLRDAVGDEWLLVESEEISDEANAGRIETHVIEIVAAVDDGRRATRVWQRVLTAQEFDDQLRAQASPLSGARYQLQAQGALTRLVLHSGAADRVHAMSYPPRLPRVLDHLFEGARLPAIGAQAQASRGFLTRILHVPDGTEISGDFTLTLKSVDGQTAQIDLAANLSFGREQGRLKGGGRAVFDFRLQHAVKAEFSGSLQDRQGGTSRRFRAQWEAVPLQRAELIDQAQRSFNWWEQTPPYLVTLPSGEDIAFRTAVLKKPKDEPDERVFTDGVRSEERYLCGLNYQLENGLVRGVSCLGAPNHATQKPWPGRLPFDLKFGDSRDQVRQKLGDTQSQALTPANAMLGYRLQREGKSYLFDLLFSVRGALERVDLWRMD